jgi:hypothetical protein
MDIAAYLRTFPPRCLAGFVATPMEWQGKHPDGHVSATQIPPRPGKVQIEAPELIYSSFALACPCGGSEFAIHGYRWASDLSDKLVLLLSPLQLQCIECRTITPVFDSDLHGYDAEQGGMVATRRAEGTPSIYTCPTCNETSFVVAVRFEHSANDFDYFPEWLGRQQDLFGWFYLAGQCQRCKRWAAITDFECA